MPEGPELKHSRDRLRELLLKKRFRKIEVVGGRYLKKPIEGMQEFMSETSTQKYSIDSIDTHGKFMWWTMGPWRMWCTYGMSGQWTRAAADKNTSVSVWTDDASGNSLSVVNFRDPRRFGTLKFTKDDAEHKKKLSTLGPDVLDDPPMTPGIFAERILIKPTRTISEALMDQSCVSGVGNYLKAEALYRAGVSPHRVVIDLKPEEIEKLWAEVVLSANESYADHGASIRTYRTVEDTAGRGQFYFRIYSRKECPSGHQVLREETLDGRTSWWCAMCQT